MTDSAEKAWWRRVDGWPPSWERNRGSLWWLASLLVFPLIALVMLSQGHTPSGGFVLNGIMASGILIWALRRERRQG